MQFSSFSPQPYVVPEVVGCLSHIHNHMIYHWIAIAMLQPAMLKPPPPGLRKKQLGGLRSLVTKLVTKKLPATEAEYCN